MKKVLFIFLASLIFAGCSSDDETFIVEDNDLVPVTIGIGVDETADSRSYLGAVSTTTGTSETPKIPHFFEQGDKIMLVDKLGNHEFKVTAGGTSSEMVGKWANPNKSDSYKSLCALSPAGSVRLVNGSPISVDENNHPTMYFELSKNQDSRNLGTDAGISYDHTINAANTSKGVGLAFACQDNKVVSPSFIPVVSFLYFFSKNESCKIKSTDFIAGNYTVKYLGSQGTYVNDPQYGSAKGMWTSGHLTITADANEISCQGKIISKHADAFKNKGYTNGPYYEFIIAIKPGTYNKGALQIINDINKDAPFRNKNAAVNFVPSTTYYLGCID